MAAAEMLGVLIPAEHIAKVIGKAGAGLKQIRESSGCKLQVQQAADSNGGPRRVDIVGLLDQIVGAFHLVLSKAFPDGNGTPTLLIPSEKAGQVIGKGGDNLKRARESFGVRLSLEREPMTDPATGAQERLLTMQGEMSQMARALRFVLGTGGGPGKLAAETALALTSGAAPAASQVRKASSDPDEVQLQFLIPDMFAGAILGKAGAQVKQTASTAGCKVSMTTRNQCAERRAVIIGAYNQAMVAQGMLFDQLMEASRVAGQEIAEITVTYLVRKEAAGAVIGKQGATLKQIRESSGAKIQLAKEEVEAQRPCTLTGTLQSVMHAEKNIFDLVRQVPVAQPDAAAAYSGGDFPVTPYTGGSYAYEDSGANKRADQSVHAPTAKRQRVDESESTTKMLVPAHCAGAVIGKQGSGLKEIRETTGAHVDMLQKEKAPQWPNDRVIALKGPAAARQAAVLAVLRMAFQTSGDTCTLKILVNGPEAGSLIGEQGNTLRYIRQQCGVSVQVERKEVFGERLVTAMGPHGLVSAAAMTVCSVLENQGLPQTEVARQPPPPTPTLAYEAYDAAALPPTPGAYVQ